MSENYITLSREIMGHWIWSEKPYDKGRAWIDLLMRARWKDGKEMYRGNLVERERGTVYCSMAFLAEKWGWHRQTVKRFLNQLESEGMVKISVTKRDTAITIENYNKYQLSESDECTSDYTSERTSECTTDSPQKKKEKKEKKEKKDIYSQAVAEIVAYLNQRTGKHFKADSTSTSRPIKARLEEKFTVEDFYRVIDIKASKWLGDPKMDDYLRPQTLFGTKFESYLNESPSTGNAFADAVLRGELE